MSARRASLWVSLAALLVAGCGDDSGSSPPPQAPPAAANKRANTAAAAAARRRGKNSKTMPLQLYTKVEEVVPEAEAAKIRQPFRARDFAPDETGNDNRDPFRSYVVRQTTNNALNTQGGVTVATTEICTEKNMVAPNPRAKDPRARKSYSLRDLRLMGIVMRGTRGYAIFHDPSGYGHMVVKGDCLGKEKARVTVIGAHLVKVEVMPEPGPNQISQEPQERKFELYQDEFPLDDEDLPDEESSSSSKKAD